MIAPPDSFYHSLGHGRGSQIARSGERRQRTDEVNQVGLPIPRPNQNSVIKKLLQRHTHILIIAAPCVDGCPESHS